MLGNEFYVGAYKDGSVWRTNKFMDVCQFPLSNSPDTRIWERQLLYCVPVSFLYSIFLLQFLLLSYQSFQVYYCRDMLVLQVPGSNSWAESTSEMTVDRSIDQTFEQRDKRGRMDFEATDMNDCQV